LGYVLTWYWSTGRCGIHDIECCSPSPLGRWETWICKSMVCQPSVGRYCVRPLCFSPDTRCTELHFLASNADIWIRWQPASVSFDPTNMEHYHNSFFFRERVYYECFTKTKGNCFTRGIDNQQLPNPSPSATTIGTVTLSQQYF
jgi:hypothetical protein